MRLDTASAQMPDHASFEKAGTLETHVGFPVSPPHAIVHAVPGFTLVRAYAEAQGIPTKRKGLASELGWRYSSMCPRTQVRANPPCHGTLTVAKTISA